MRGKTQHPAYLLFLEFDPTSAAATIEPADQSLVSFTEHDTALAGLNWALEHAVHGDLVLPPGTPEAPPAEAEQMQQRLSLLSTGQLVVNHDDSSGQQTLQVWRNKSKSDPTIVTMLEGFFAAQDERGTQSDSETSSTSSNSNRQLRSNSKKATKEVTRQQQLVAPKSCAAEESILKYAAIANKQVCALERADMAHVVALCQLDNKYILARWRSMVLVFDQHAVHERIRLERLENAVFGPDGTQRNYEAVAGSWLWPLSDTDAARLVHFHAQVEQWGFCWRLVREHGGTQAALVTQVPRVAGVVLDAPCLKSFLAALEASGGSTSTRPPSIAAILAARACKSAVKFGDALAEGVCQSLLCALGACRLPFQCAHGRPNVYPLADCAAVLAYAAQCGSSSSSRRCDKAAAACGSGEEDAQQDQEQDRLGG